ncbi:MAG: TonB-dependent receptor [Rhodothermales bacterium]
MKFLTFLPEYQPILEVNMLRNWSIILLLLLSMPTLVFAQSNGKLSGRVTDGSTGDGLPGANVILQGTNIGATTDLDGNYVIIGIPVGTYAVQTSFVGFSGELVQGVEINAGYTREINFELLPGIELDEVVVEYEQPLIQKDAIGVPKIVTAEDIVNLPVRGAADVAKIQAGVVSQEGSDNINVRGGRSGEVAYFVDGIKFGSGGVNIPQSAIEQQEMQLGNISARYGDVMSGVINITTKSGAAEFFGSLEGITSQELDSYGYNLVSGTFGGPIIKDKLSFFVAGEYTFEDDGSPRAFGQLRINDSTLDDLRAFPAAFRTNDASGNEVFLPIPAGLADGAQLLVDDDAHPILSNGALSFDDGTTVAVPDGVDANALNLTPVIRAEYLSDDSYSVEKAKRARNDENLALIGNMTLEVFENGRLRVGGRYRTREFDTNVSARRVLFAPEMTQVREDEDYQVYGTYTHRLSNTSFFQVQADYSNNFQETYDPRFGTGFDDFLEYGNIDNAAFATLRGYKDLGFTQETRIDGHGTPDPADDTEFTVNVPTFSNTYGDGQGPATSDEVIASLVQIPGGRFNGYSKFKSEQIRFSGSFTGQFGLHQIEFGGEFEKDTQRNWAISAASLSRFVADGNPEQIATGDPSLNPDGYSTFDSIPLQLLDTAVSSYYGYDLRGQNEVDSENFGNFLNQDTGKPLADYNLKPYEPMYYGGYIQDKIEFNDIVLNLGIRADVFDNNVRVFKDRFARRPVCRAGDVGSTVNGVDCGAGTVPAGLDPENTVFYSGDTIIGYRDTQGNFFTSTGDESSLGDITLNGAARQTSNLITEDQFEKYDPVLNIMPRIGISFPVTDQAVFFASYGITSQRPSSRTFATLNAVQGTGTINNTNLQPEKTTKYELGFRQRLGDRSALTISGFFNQIENLIQLRDIRNATPNSYSSYENVDFGTVKGIEFAFDLRRTNGFLANLNYTVSFADGTGSGDRTTSTIVWIDETPPNFISPLDFDQRHNLNLSLDYRLGKGEGPEVLGVKLFENFGVNVLAKAGSGFPYTPVVEPFNAAGGARAAAPSGGINSARMPWSNRVDLRVDRRFEVAGRASLTAFFWVQNVFNNNNTNNVWRFTGTPDVDGFLGTSAGERFLNDSVPFAQAAYSHDNRVLNWVGIPRMTRIGLRLDF